MPSQRTCLTSIPVRFGLYGLAVGLLLGVPAGVRLSSSGWLLPGSYRAWMEDPALLDGRFPGVVSSPLEQFNLEGLLVGRREIVHGGPPKDGIPSLMNPRTVPLASADSMRAEDRVVGMTIADESRAYPIRLLTYHEVVNDTLGGVPIAVIYCPLCDSVSVVDRRLDDTTLTFGVSGLVQNSNVLMYDREHQGLWSQLGFMAISGPFAGRALKHLPWQIQAFDRWSEAHPESTVVSFDNGYRRDYDHSPYTDYFLNDELQFPVAVSDGRLPRKQAVVGVRLGDVARAYPVATIQSAPHGRLEDRVGDHRLVLEATQQGGVTVIQAPPEAQVVHTFWFAWVSFHPNTELVTRDSPSSADGAGVG